MSALTIRWYPILAAVCSDVFPFFRTILKQLSSVSIIALTTSK
uniref:Uncharacterized protein n=1 Tax=Arundo donax TaxID=35708 RepID=A0A0A9HDX8_ARUDO